MGIRTSTWNSLHVLGPVRRCAVILRGGSRCAWCEVELDQWGAQIDHVVARRFDGKDSIDNLVPACAGCNESRNLRARLRAFGISFSSQKKKVDAQLAMPIDRKAGRELAAQWYPWFSAWAEKNRVKQRDRDKKNREHRKTRRRKEPRQCGCKARGKHKCGGGDLSFDFGANVEP